MGCDYPMAVSLSLPESVLTSVNDNQLLKWIQVYSKKSVKLSVVQKIQADFHIHHIFLTVLDVFIQYENKKHNKTRKE